MLFTILFLSLVMPRPVTSQTWASSLELAEREEKLLVVFMSATWCGPCQRFRSTTLSDDRVRDFLDEHVVFVEFDGEKGDGVDLVKKYRVPGYPTLLIVEANGELVDKKLGVLGPSEFINWIRHALP